MKKLRIFILFALFFITSITPVKNVIADISPQPKHQKIITPDTLHEQDTSVIRDTAERKQIQGNLNYLELIKPGYIATGGAVFVIVLFSFVILSKIRNKE